MVPDHLDLFVHQVTGVSLFVSCSHDCPHNLAGDRPGIWTYPNEVRMHTKIYQHAALPHIHCKIVCSAHGIEVHEHSRAREEGRIRGSTLEESLRAIIAWTEYARVSKETIWTQWLQDIKSKEEGYHPWTLEFWKAAVNGVFVARLQVVSGTSSNIRSVFTDGSFGATGNASRPEDRSYEGWEMRNWMRQYPDIPTHEQPNVRSMNLQLVYQGKTGIVGEPDPNPSLPCFGPRISAISGNSFTGQPHNGMQFVGVAQTALQQILHIINLAASASQSVTTQDDPEIPPSLQDEQLESAHQSAASFPHHSSEAFASQSCVKEITLPLSDPVYTPHTFALSVPLASGPSSPNLPSDARPSPLPNCAPLVPELLLTLPPPESPLDACSLSPPGSVSDASGPSFHLPCLPHADSHINLGRKRTVMAYVLIPPLPRDSVEAAYYKPHPRTLERVMSSVDAPISSLFDTPPSQPTTSSSPSLAAPPTKVVGTDVVSMRKLPRVRSTARFRRGPFLPETLLPDNADVEESKGLLIYQGAVYNLEGAMIGRGYVRTLKDNEPVHFVPL
ncbi:hypothetical protein D9757_011695 [Collybiopsis confluens]|uniref:Uncharacterized protein n=1 Tax=Collybiopsis confluens TaxID=2823264 RepID=A0A8H5GM33_9AGAR|nr:hypothetical protein D9757_011695 [Collybiopsis confluens]